MQNPRSAFNPLRTMAAHARETCRALGKPADDATLIAALGDVGLEAPERVLTLYPFEMSGGMLQRMMIAMALLSDAAFIVADEPTTDLDAVAQAKILDLLERLLQTRHCGMLLVTHDMGVVARLADDGGDGGRAYCRAGQCRCAVSHPATSGDTQSGGGASGAVRDGT
jgi:nickel transport system ATP-binding protein